MAGLEGGAGFPTPPLHMEPEPDVRISQNWGYLLQGSYNEDSSSSGSILGSPDFGKLACCFVPASQLFQCSLL